jgi:hypothetical protein
MQLVGTSITLFLWSTPVSLGAFEADNQSYRRLTPGRRSSRTSFPDQPRVQWKVLWLLGGKYVRRQFSEANEQGKCEESASSGNLPGDESDPKVGLYKRTSVTHLQAKGYFINQNQVKAVLTRNRLSRIG